jgi:hypothetical protein
MRAAVLLVLLLAGVAVGFFVGPRATSRASAERSKGGTDAARLTSTADEARAGSRELTGRAAPIRVASRDGVQYDTHADDYDPSVLAAIGMSVHEVFELEERNRAWAVPREGFISKQMEKDLLEHFPDAKLESVECHTSSCEITVTAPESQRSDVFRYIQQPPLGSTMSPEIGELEADGRRRMSMTVLMSPEMRDHATYEQWYAGRRAEILPALRDMGRLVPTP